MILVTTLLEFVLLLIGLFLVVDLFTGFKMLGSIVNRLRLKADKAAEAVRDPEADAHAALNNIRSRKAAMVELRKKILVAIGTAKSKQRTAQAEVERYEGLAQLAGKAKNADDVGLALTKKAAAQQKLTDATSEVTKRTKQEDELEAKIAEFDILIEKAETDKDYLVSQFSINNFDTEVNQVLKSGGDAASALDTLRADVERSRIEAEVSGELSAESAGLEAKYATKGGVSADDIAKYLA